MATVEALASASAKLHNFPSLSDAEYDCQIRDLVANCRNLLSTKALGSVSHDESTLDDLDPGRDSIVYLFLLRLRIQTLQESSRGTLPYDILPRGRLWSKAVRYLESFDPVQVRYAGHEFRQLIEIIGQASEAVSKPLLATRPIREAILRLDPSCAVFTSTHLLFIQLCLKARSYACALPVLDKHVCHFPALSSRASSNLSSSLCTRNETSLTFITDSSGLSSKLTYKDYLRYFLYGGMVYMALKKWRKALHLLGVVISMPTAGSISMVMVEAYKKWVLVGLLAKGKLSSPPSVTSPHVVRLYQSLAKPYISLAQAFERGDMKKLSAEVDTARNIWVMDHNMGLVAQVVDTFSGHAIIGLRKTFAALTVAEVLEQAPYMPADPMATESVIASLIMSGAMNAELVHSSSHTCDSMLRLPGKSFSSQMSHESHVQVRLKEEGPLMTALMGSLEEINRAMGLSDEFVDSSKGQTWTASSDVKQGLGEDFGLDIDEDIMGG